MRRALVLQHMDNDHPGRFLDFFAEDGIVPEFVRLWDGEEIPSLAPYDFMFVLGGAQDTWQEAEYPWLGAEKAAIREWVGARARPYFGVCLGHQLLCAAMGGEVGPATQPENGVLTVELTDAGQRHPLYAGLGSTHPVIQWHDAEVKQPPPGAEVLATSARCPVQSVAIGTHAIGTQFHCECSPQTMVTWTSSPDLVAVFGKRHGAGFHRRFLADSYALMPQMTAMTRRLYDNFAAASGLHR